METSLDYFLQSREPLLLEIETTELSQREPVGESSPDEAFAVTDRRFLFLDEDRFSDLRFSDISSINIDKLQKTRSYTFIGPLLPGIVLLIFSIIGYFPTIGDLPDSVHLGVLLTSLVLLFASSVLFYIFLQIKPGGEYIVGLHSNSKEYYEFRLPDTPEYRKEVYKLVEILRRTETIKVIPEKDTE